MMLVTRPRLLPYPYIVTKTQNLLSRYQSVSFDETCAPINIFSQGGGGGGGGEGFPAGIRQLELLEKSV